MAEQPLRSRPAEEREILSEGIADRLDKPMTVLGVLFLLLVLAETTTDPQGALATTYTVVGWVIWGAFVAEFVVRAAVAPSAARFWKRNWWQLIFLALPFLRFLRLLARVRVRPIVRAGRVLSSAVRGTRTAGRTLSGRVGWVAAVTTIVVLASSQLLFEFAGYDSYAAALHEAALSAIAGEPLHGGEGIARVLEVVLAAYSVAVFASLAGILGAFFLERRPAAESSG